MEAGIVGLPNVGKTLLFNAMTGMDGEAGNYPFTTTKSMTGVAKVPDPRLQTIKGFIPTEKIIPATLQLVDMPGLVRGAGEGEGMGNRFLAEIRNVDALVHLVRCFEDDDVPHVDDSVDPLRDIETIDLELIAADAQVVEGSMVKAKKLARTGDKEAKARVEALEKCGEVLSELMPVRNADLSDADKDALKSFALLTAKPVLYVANIGEGDVGSETEHLERVRDHAKEQGGEVVGLCTKLEAEIAELDEDDRKEMLESMGLEEPALAVMARGIYRLLGLQSFFTAGEKEIRAWTIPIAATAPQAAGAIHSDFERGFIRAEVYHLDDLVAHKTEVAIKAAGKMRLEGKGYVVQEGDICHFLFNV